jgi:ankyrin repeat protein
MKKQLFLSILTIGLLANHVQADDCSSEYPELLIYADRGDIEKAKDLLQNGYDVNIRDEFGQTALIVAAEDCDLEMVKLLLAHGADVNLQEKDGYTALMAAIENQFWTEEDNEEQYNAALEIVKMLLKHGAHVNLKNEENYTALMIALDNSYLEIAKLLLKNGAKITNEEQLSCFINILLSLS